MNLYTLILEMCYCKLAFVSYWLFYWLKYHKFLITTHTIYKRISILQTMHILLDNGNPTTI